MSTLDDNDPYTAPFDARYHIPPQRINGATGELGVWAPSADNTLIRRFSASVIRSPGDEVVGRIVVSALKLLTLLIFNAGIGQIIRRSYQLEPFFRLLVTATMVSTLSDTRLSQLSDGSETNLTSRQP
ncbi:hypothetical protein DFH08DRAFT_821123 [Mycena albidolilacea]|uniref:Uncharacterized protein n=1 Tax=Mycena albidolilacea TaxID=1033008 RepID=A0AAD6ZBU3_9AGAR|nr:hypothetical protein DFH08DRAFT_821123 [Mycena albidolilacea]